MKLHWCQAVGQAVETPPPAQIFPPKFRTQRHKKISNLDAPYTTITVDSCWVKCRISTYQQ